jgi:hypothetical protein
LLYIGRAAVSPIPTLRGPLKPLPFYSPLNRRQILQGSAALAIATYLPGCSSSGGTTVTTPITTPPAGTQPAPSGPLTVATISVAATTTGAIGSNFAGLSYEKSTLYEPLFTASNANLIGLFQRLGPSLLRIGGNSVDRNIWTPTGAGQTAGQIAPSDVAACAAFVKAAGWKVLYGINLGGSATGAQTPALAAAEVAYAAAQFGSSLYGIEIGNECDLYGNSGSYYAGNWSLAQFETLWTQYRTAILATTPGVTITGPASAGSESTWTVPFGEFATKNEISLLTQHYYRGDGQSASSTAANLITPDSSLLSDLQKLYAGAQTIGIPYRMSECNSYYNGGADGISDSYASALWVIDFLFNCAQNNCAGANFHGGGESTGYTPIADNNGTVVEARPEFYGMLLFTLAGQGSLYTTAITAGSLNATAYTVKTAAGLSLVVINKDSTQNLQLTATLPQTVTSATLLNMRQLSTGASAPVLSATSGVTIQGATINPNGSFTPNPAYTLVAGGDTINCYVPALSAILVTIA